MDSPSCFSWPTTATTWLWLALAISAASHEVAADEEMLGEFTDWKAMTYWENGGLVCSMWSEPIESSGGAERPAHAYVVHRMGVANKVPASYHTVTLEFGVELKGGQPVKGKVGSQRFELYADDNWAWNHFQKEDRRLVQSMRAGATLTVTATTASGGQISYSYSLSGFTAAHNAINEACKVSRP